MTLLSFIRHSFTHYLRRHLVVGAGLAVSTAVLAGALIIGDSVRYSLEQITYARLGNVSLMASSGDRWFRAALAREVQDETGSIVAPLVLMEGMAVSGGGEQRVNKIQITGIDGSFGQLQGTAIFDSLRGDEVVLSENLAVRLQVKVGDPVQVRLPKASVVPKNAPFVSDEENTVSWRATVRAIAGREDMGLFNLKNSQSAPYNLFVSADKLNSLAGMDGKANTLVVAGNSDVEAIRNAIRTSFRPVDASLLFKHISATGEWEVSTDRVFLEENGARIFSSLPGARPILTYFVNTLESNGKKVPYSFASSWEIEGLQPGEAIVNQWVADELRLKAGDSLKMSYYEIGPLRQLVVRERLWRVKEIVPLSGRYGDRELMPLIPGLSDAGHCREWKAGIPVKLDEIRQKDEDYWNEYRGMPKVFLSLDEAQQLWANRFGRLTAIRFPSGEMDSLRLEKQFALGADPADFGISLHELRENGVESARLGVDFGQLFLGLSFFLLLGAIILSALLFRLNLENRAPQVGTLLQLGFTKRQVWRLLFSEGMVMAIPAIVTGLLLSIGYVMLIFTFLNSLWWEIVRTPALFIDVTLSTLLMAFLSSLAISALSLGIPLRRFMKRQIATLSKNLKPAGTSFFSRYCGLLAVFFIVSALLLVVWQLTVARQIQSSVFFLSGILMLGGLLLVVHSLVRRGEILKNVQEHSFGNALRSVGLNHARSLTVVALFALGTFIVVTTGANRQDISAQAENRTSGTGGFSLMAELSAPLLWDLNDSARRITEGLTEEFTAVQFHRVEGDDASCLNLNRISNPAILGVDARELTGRFSFVASTNDLDPENPWLSLQKELPGGVIPAIVDQTVIQWGLGMKTGDTLLYQAENGDTIRFRMIAGLAPSVFQGNILIDKAFFHHYYPTHSGSPVLLIDALAENREEVAGSLKDLLRDNGIDLVSTVEKLVGFYSVTNTYLSIFLALGALGLVLGTIGLTVVLARSILERKGELGVLMAIGFTKKQLVGRLFSEYSLLLVTGTLTGVISAAITILPVLKQSISSLPLGWILFLVFFILLHGMVWIYLLALTMINREKVSAALRDE